MLAVWNLWNRSTGIDLDGISYRRTRREIWRTKEAFDIRKTDPLPYKPEDDPLVITNELTHNVSAKQSIATEPHTILRSSRGIHTSPTNDTNCAVIDLTKVRGISRYVQLPSKFQDYIMT